MRQISPRQLADWLAESEQPAAPTRRKPLLLDVREPWEFEQCQIAGALPMPMQSVPARLHELDADAEVVVICHHGARSTQVAMFLERNGFTTYNLAGGVDAWARDVDPAMRKY